MSHQFSYFMTPEDMGRMEKILREITPMHILHSRSATADPRIIPSLDFEEEGKRLLSRCLVRAADLPLVVTHHVPQQGYWVIETLYSPVIEFDGCYFDGKVLRLDRAYYVDGYYNKEGQWTEKPEEFRQWAKSVFRTAKRSLKRCGKNYIGQDAAAWAARGGQLLEASQVAPRA